MVYTVGAVYTTWQQYQYQYQVVYTVGAVAAAYELYSSVTQVLVLETNFKINIRDINIYRYGPHQFQYQSRSHQHQHG